MRRTTKNVFILWWKWCNRFRFYQTKLETVIHSICTVLCEFDISVWWIVSPIKQMFVLHWWPMIERRAIHHSVILLQDCRYAEQQYQLKCLQSNRLNALRKILAIAEQFSIEIYLFHSESTKTCICSFWFSGAHCFEAIAYFFR